MTAGRTINTKNCDWGTPLKYVNAVRDMFNGKIDLDPCSNVFSIVGACCEYSFPRNNGLIDSWDYSTIYVNPPYGFDKTNRTRIRDWLLRCEKSYQNYGSEVLALIPVATNTSHWKKFIWGKAAAICFLYDTRLRFLMNGEDCGNGAPMSCAMVYWGRKFDKFKSIFNKFGAVVEIIKE